MPSKTPNTKRRKATIPAWKNLSVAAEMSFITYLGIWCNQYRITRLGKWTGKMNKIEMSYDRAIELLSNAALGRYLTWDADFRDALAMAVRALIEKRAREAAGQA